MVSPGGAGHAVFIRNDTHAADMAPACGLDDDGLVHDRDTFAFRQRRQGSPRLGAWVDDQHLRTMTVKVERRPISIVVIGKHHGAPRSEEHTSELQSLMRISYAVFCLKKKNKK